MDNNSSLVMDFISKLSGRYESSCSSPINFLSISSFVSFLLLLKYGILNPPKHPRGNNFFLPLKTSNTNSLPNCGPSGKYNAILEKLYII